MVIIISPSVLAKTGTREVNRMLNIRYERLESGLIRVYSLYTRSEIGLVSTYREAEEIAREHTRRMR